MQPEEEAQERDVDSRVSCTRALGAACQTLMLASVDGALDPKGAAVDSMKAIELLHLKVRWHRLTPNQTIGQLMSVTFLTTLTKTLNVVSVQLCQVLPALQGALKDYTIDNRGDVGSWVRDAAMEVLVQAVQMAARLHHVSGHDVVREASLRGGCAARQVYLMSPRPYLLNKPIS